MSQWRLVLILVAGLAYAGLSHWMMLYHATAPWALAALFAPLWLAVLGLGACPSSGNLRSASIRCPATCAPIPMRSRNLAPESTGSPLMQVGREKPAALQEPPTGGAPAAP